MMHTKFAPLTGVKAGPDDGLEEGTFTAYASVFDNVDAYGDVVRKGAFTETLDEWSKGDAELPLRFGHRFDDPDFNIGHIVKAEEDDHGLLVTGRLDIEADTGKAKQVYRLVKGRRINQMSFAYDVLESSEVTEDGEKFVELTKLSLYEVSVVPIGANQSTEILAVKAAEAASRSLAAQIATGQKEGRVLAAKHIDSLRSAQDAIGAVIEAAEGTDQEKATGPDCLATPGTPGAREKSSGPSVDSLALERLGIQLEALI
jgi:HK97 family phage prohead protease